MSSKYFIQTILSGQMDSAGFMTNEDGIRGPMTVLILAPTLVETCTLQVAGPLGNYCTLQSGDTDITLMSSRAKQVMIVNASKIRIHASAPVAADRVFELLWNVTTLNQR